jgi:hypothetical protein
MQKIIAIILILVFVSSTTAILYKNFSNGKTAIMASDCDDVDNEQDSVKEPLFAKAKLMTVVYSIFFTMSNKEKYYASHQYCLPSPYLLVDIIPPELN